MEHNEAAKNPLKKDLLWDNDAYKKNYNKLLFDNFFMDLKGKAAVADEFLARPQCGMHASVKNDNIKFHRPHAEDPDELVSCSCSFCRIIFEQIEHSPAFTDQVVFHADDQCNHRD